MGTVDLSTRLPPGGSDPHGFTARPAEPDLRPMALSVSRRMLAGREHFQVLRPPVLRVAVSMVDMAPCPDWAIGFPRYNPMDVCQPVSHSRRVAWVVDARISAGPVDLPASEGRADGHWGIWDRGGEARGPPASAASLSQPTREEGPLPSGIAARSRARRSRTRRSPREPATTSPDRERASSTLGHHRQMAVRFPS